MAKTRIPVIFAITSCLLVTPLFAYTNPKQTDPLQAYREEIKQAETTASQTLLNQLDPRIQDTNTNLYEPAPPTPTPPPSPSNNEKAFSPPTEMKKNTNANPDSGEKKPNMNNPWLKPNPWESQSKINPWANAPIPGPNPPSTPSTFTPTPPPNIFAPPQAAKPLDKTMNKQTTTIN